MGAVHDLIESQGKQAALRTDIDRREVEAAAAYLADEDSGIGFLYSGWCQAGLPHRRLPNDQVWQISTDRLTLLVEPGRRPATIPSQQPDLIGIPYGSRARLIMLYLQKEALRTGRREVQLGRSMREWLQRLGVPIGGKSMAGVRDQAERISRCRLTFHISAGRRSALQNQNIVDTAIFLDTSADDAQQSLFVEEAKLSEAFFEELKRHPVPLEEAAVRAINNNSMALDAYAWLAYRLHALTSPRMVPWPALKAQFGGGFNRLDHFRSTFLAAVCLAMAVYRDAKVESEDKGLKIFPSRPPVAPRQVAYSPVKSIQALR
jgi:hypothetical protein